MNASVKSDFWSHPKVARLSLEAKAFWLCGLLHACHHRTGGSVPRCVLMSESDNYESIAAELVDANLWEYSNEGWIIHDFHQWNPNPQPADILAESVRIGAGVPVHAWDPTYARQIRPWMCESGITPEEVEQVTNWLLTEWAAKPLGHQVTGLPKFETIIKSLPIWRRTKSRPRRAASYLTEKLNGPRSGGINPRSALHRVEVGGD